jgi:excisionase family DNA binding protein
MDDIKMLTVNEVAKLLKVSPRTVRNYIKDGKLKAVKIGSTNRIPENVINELINNSLSK